MKRQSAKATLYDLDDKEKLKEEMDSSYLFVNGTGVGMKPLEDLSVVPDKSFFRPELIVVDVPYSPLETKMRKMAKRSWMQDNERTWNDAVPGSCCIQALDRKRDADRPHEGSPEHQI